MDLTISALSKEYVRVKVSATEAGTTVDPTSDTVTMAFVAVGTTPVSGDFKTATWETDNGYYSRCLVGPGGTVTLAVGTYSIFVKVTDSPEVPVLKAKSNLRVL